MAYRAFDDELFAPVAHAPAEASASATDQPPFSALEMSVIALSKSETPWSLQAPSRFGSLVESLFAIKRPNPLADPRLEALRRFAILARSVGDRIADAEINAFLRAGFSRIQAAWLRHNAHAPILAR